MSTPTAAVPKYYRVKLEILRLVDGATPGTVIPTERALAETFATSRSTVRQAIAELVAEGRLDRTQGSGTFVAPPKLTHVRQLTSFSEDAVAQGRETSSEVLSLERVPLDAADAELLGRHAGERAYRVERLRCLDGDPLAHEVALLPGSLPALRKELARRGSLYLTLREAYGIEIADVEDTVETALAGPEETALLEVEMGAPLLVVQRLARDADGVAVELTRSAFRGDRFRFVARLRAQPAP
jgi:GntR family transcriptional regulator